jgi:hypothetical protein
MRSTGIACARPGQGRGVRRCIKSLLETRSREKRDFLARLVCNPRLDGRTVRFDLRKPFAVLAKMRAANDWRPQGEAPVTDSVPRLAYSVDYAGPTFAMAYVA